MLTLFSSFMSVDLFKHIRLFFIFISNIFFICFISFLFTQEVPCCPTCFAVFMSLFFIILIIIKEPTMIATLIIGTYLFIVIFILRKIEWIVRELFLLLVVII